MTAFSQIELANAALRACGQNSITSISQDDKGAREINRAWNLVRTSTLTKYRWNFAKKRDSLAADPDAPAFGFARRYAKPPDMLKLIGIGDDRETQRNYTSSDVIYKFEGGFILTDENAPLNITYIRDITDPAEFDPDFAQVFQLSLAKDIYYALTKGVDRYKQILNDLAMAVRAAKFSHAIENTPEVIQASDWVDSRFSDGGPYGLRIGPVI